MTPELKELLRFGALLLAGLTIGALTGAYALSLVVALLLWVWLQIVEFRRLERWSRRPLSRPGNLLELWRRPTERLYRSLRSNRRRSHRLMNQIRRLQTATEALPDGAVLIRYNGTIEALNTPARELLGLRREDQGQNLGALVRHPDLSALIHGEIDEQLVEIPAPTNDERRLEIRRILVDEGRVLILARDVTQLNRLLTMRQDFIANVSHELRTPLTVITGYLETLQDESLDAETLRTLLSKLVSPAERMRALVDDLLLLTRLESSPALDLQQLDIIDVPALVRRVIADAEQLSEGRHALIAHLDEGLGLHGVESELYSAFGNLVANAVRYSPEGGDITVRWQRTADGPRFAVEDEGMGIPEEHLSRLTERFYRVDLAGSRSRGGTGLGLAIVKHVLRRHETGLEVHSELGRGSSFQCVFPARFAVHAAPDTVPRTIPGEGAPDGAEQ